MVTNKKASEGVMSADEYFDDGDISETEYLLQLELKNKSLESEVRRLEGELKDHVRICCSKEREINLLKDGVATLDAYGLEKKAENKKLRDCVDNVKKQRLSKIGDHPDLLRKCTVYNIVINCLKELEQSKNTVGNK